MKEGITFQEAYLLPIPIVAVDIDFEDSTYDVPVDQPTAEARLPSTLDVVIAEPTEYSSLIRNR